MLHSFHLVVEVELYLSGNFKYLYSHLKYQYFTSHHITS